MTDWITRGKTIRQLIDELGTFEDQGLEVRISTDNAATQHAISLVARHEGSCLLLNCEMNRDGVQAQSVDKPGVLREGDHGPAQPPAEGRFPQKGDVYSAVAPYQADLMIAWSLPVTTAARFVLEAGCQIRIESETFDRPAVLYARPVDYRSVEKKAVRWWIRMRPSYGGYYLAVSTADIGRFFELVSAAELPAPRNTA